MAFADGGNASASLFADSAGWETSAPGEQALAALPLARPGSAAPVLRRMCAGCDEDEQNRKIWRTAISSAEAHGGLGALMSGILPSPGQSLDPVARDYLQGLGAHNSSGADAPLAAPAGARIQPQLEIGRADDPLELEADEMADHVVRRQAADVDDEGAAPPVQAKAEGSGPAASTSSGLDAGVASASAGGAGVPLAAQTRARMEASFDADFSAVRVHAGASSAGMCDEIGARAFTYGTDIHFNQGEFAPGTERGTRLLAHELTHVVQQNGGVRRSPKRIQAKPQLGPRVFGPETGMPTGTLLHNEGILHLFEAPNKGLLIEPAVPGANKGLVDPLRSGNPDFYRDNSSGKPIGLKQGLDKPFKAINGADGAPKPPLKNKPVRSLPDAPTDIELGDLKPGHSGEEHLGQLQLGSYIKGIENTTKAVNSYQVSQNSTEKWTHATQTPKPMGELVIPTKVRAPNTGGIRYGPLAVYEWVGKWWKRSATDLKGSCIVYKSKVPGIWAYEWMPASVGENTGSKAITKSVLDRLEKDVKPLLHSSGKKVTPKLKPAHRAPSVAALKRPGPRLLQRKPKHEQFDDAGWNKTYGKWQDDTEKVLGDPKAKADVSVLETLTAAKDRTGVDPGIPQSVTDRAKDVATVRHWVRYGKLYGWFRKTFDRVYVKLAGFAQKVKDKVKNLVKSGGSSGFGNWIKAAALALFKVAKKLGAWAISMIVDKLLDSLQDGVSNIIKQLAEAVTPEGVKSKIEEIEELKAKYELMLGEAQESLEKLLFGDKLEMFSQLQKYMDIASTISTIVSVVRWGIRIVACASPPLIGCLWNLAIAALEYAFAKIMETCWFSAKVLGWIRDSGIQAILDYPAQVAQTIARQGNEVLKMPEGVGPLFGKIEINHREFDIDCRAGGGDNGGGPEPTEEQKALMALAKEVGDEKLEAFLEMAAKRAADHNVALDAERIKKLGPLIHALSVDQMKKLAANQPTDGVPVSVEEFLKSIATHTPAETARKETRKIDYDKAQRSNPKFEQSQIKWKPQLFVREGIASDSKEFADAIYDIQVMLGVKPDGMAGPTTTKLFYEKNKQAKDGAYDNAAKLVEAEQAAIAERNATEKRRKELRALLNEPDVKAALEAKFPPNEQLKKDLTGLHWENLETDSMQFIQHKGQAIIGIKTDAGHAIGAYFHYAERDFPGSKTKMKMIVKTSQFYALDEISDTEGINNLVTFEDGLTGISIIALKKQEKGSFFEMGPIFFGKFVDF